MSRPMTDTEKARFELAEECFLEHDKKYGMSKDSKQNYINGFLDGFAKVARDVWHNCGEWDFPNNGVECFCLDYNNQPCIAFCDYDTKLWHDCKTNKAINVAKWQYVDFHFEIIK